jgi:GNAT superfamily N-acetyltransferase
MEVFIRQTQKKDIPQIIELSRVIYQEKSAWTEKELNSHLEVFPEGQFVAAEKETGKIVGMAASLIVLWDDYDIRENWEDFTANGMFTNHDAENGRTLYGAEVMVSQGKRRAGIGKKLYATRRKLVEELDLLRIRAGARLRNYHRYADKIPPEAYVAKILKGEIKDPTLSFQIKQGFRIIAVVDDYLDHDRESLGKAAIIEWLNQKAINAETRMK